ncbi:glycine zipper 2TM domain-containing protein [Altererythrobacter aerius]|uniref:17 kDa surface antigen n=1 Tax=Tsuneonella aeria TaxID=1837929 RepID=A0A6I4THC8_9SPHN|nr:glycine zipper 2TM domain-containing protein [Tsuneonella aeria]MXO76076.1 glycine zipper 2TM domain-containing protein [Tsuneonella aeria]
MTQFKLKTAALALAVPGLAMAVPAVPAAAAPAAHAAAYNTSAVWGDQAAHQYRDRYRNYDRRAYGSRYSSYGEPVYDSTRVWRGEDNRYYCRKSNGTTGLLIGGAGGALLGREIAGRGGDRTLGAILGAAGGALLGRAIDKGGSRCR